MFFLGWNCEVKQCSCLSCGVLHCVAAVMSHFLHTAPDSLASFYLSSESQTGKGFRESFYFSLWSFRFHCSHLLHQSRTPDTSCWMIKHHAFKQTTPLFLSISPLLSDSCRPFSELRKSRTSSNSWPITFTLSLFFCSPDLVTNWRCCEQHTAFSCCTCYLCWCDVTCLSAVMLLHLSHKHHHSPPLT